MSLLDGILLSIPHIRVPAIAGLAVQVEHDTGLHRGFIVLAIILDKDTQELSGVSGVAIPTQIVRAK